ncbi:hypothetical protein NTGZN8_90024 [Candidatus Nitrotoga fabula]|uniref:Uncharacterized protein n=1 Tax=Candidatus Nitrotoga fabula TaxID=2182327 RepID=A0A916BFN3_9PROT|nr:hypothetical protein NTGZN8_90024 [Candidatus Nitrotoga fabula]
MNGYLMHLIISYLANKAVKNYIGRHVPD